MNLRKLLQFCDNFFYRKWITIIFQNGVGYFYAVFQLQEIGKLCSNIILKNNNLLYAAGDCISWVATPNSNPPTGFEDISTIAGATYKNCGWLDTSGYIFKLDETIKDIPAAGVLTPIRTILTGGTKSIQTRSEEHTSELQSQR